MSQNKTNPARIAFLGTPDFSVKILNSLKEAGMTPDLIVTNPDEPKGRKLILTPPPVKVWAEENKIKYIQPENLKTIPEEFQPEADQPLAEKTSGFDLFIVAAYGRLIPQAVLDLPKHGTLNVHPSLLPKYRGASPIQSAILNGDEKTGTSIMLLDAGLDHGPILAQEKLSLADWSPNFPELLNKLADISGKLLVKTIPRWISGDIKAEEQDHTLATFCKKIEKDFGFISAEDILNPGLSTEKVYEIERKVRALNPDPGTFTIIKSKGKKVRVKITKAKISDGKLIIEKVIPEGKKEMLWEDWKRGNLMQE